MSEIERCDEEVFIGGASVVAVVGSAEDVEPWVQRVARLPGERVDWHYAGGIAQVLVLGGAEAHERAAHAVAELELELAEDAPVRVRRRYAVRDRGLSRLGSP